MYIFVYIYIYMTDAYRSSVGRVCAVVVAYVREKVERARGQGAGGVRDGREEPFGWGSVRGLGMGSVAAGQGECKHIKAAEAF